MPLSTNAGLKVYTTGEVLTAGSMNTAVNQQTLLYYASFAALTAALTGATSPVAGVHAYLDDEKAMLVYNGTNWIQITPEASAIQTGSETFTGTNYTTNQPATPGPAISIRTGTTALITVGSAFTVNAGIQGFQSVAVTGATTQAASDAYALIVGNMSTTSNFVQGYSKTLFITGLTAGLNTFTCAYRVTGGTGTIAQRYISGNGLLQA
jgi:hypothetical protein